MQLPVDRYAVVEGLRLRYWLEGEDGPHLVLIHGIGGSVDVWRKQFEQLPRTHRVLALDLPGCGCSAIPIAYPFDTLRILATAVRGLMQQVGMEQATLIGSSLGGAVTVEFAMRWPELVASLVLIGPAGMTHKVAWPLRLMSVRGVGELLTHPDRARTAQAIRQCVADPAAVTESDIDRAFVMANLPGAQAAFLRLLRVYAGLRGIDRRELLRLQAGMRTIHAPVLVVWGAQDRILPISAAANARVHLPNAGLVIRPQRGHLVFVEEPEMFGQMVAEFVRAPDQVLARSNTALPAPQAPARQFLNQLRAMRLAFIASRLPRRTGVAASAGMLLLFAFQYSRQRQDQGKSPLHDCHPSNCQPKL
ncbi:alpha/beta fold hydrolase [Caldilinea sp.]|uniref:alpha/beta fold hydrolase n=1 Tax=Caldilinea sp. TaxID=2293560 RepID=UPI002D021E43|nr:alpha/beta fold hydrolase [Caldilinea sp.]